MEYRLIAIDMDGTLLNSQREVSPRNREVLIRAMDRNIDIVLATGRMLKSASYYSKSIGLNNPIIASNGALVYCGRNGEMLYESSIDIGLVKKLSILADEINMYYHFFDHDSYYSKAVGPGLMEYHKIYAPSLREQKIKLELFKNPDKILKESRPRIYKFVAIDEDEEKLSTFREGLKEIKGISVSSSWYNNVEVMNEGVSKGMGLKHLKERLNLKKSQIIAIGDNENDISMFNLAGLAIGMENGLANVKQYADVITDTNDKDGVAKAIEKYVL